jgi:hypothetical protein
MKIQLDTDVEGVTMLLEAEGNNRVEFSYNEEYFTVDINELFSAVEVLKEQNDKFSK